MTCAMILKKYPRTLVGHRDWEHSAALDGDGEEGEGHQRKDHFPT